jgi:hypothetical protein
MTATDGTFAQWLAQAQIAADRLSAEQRGVLQAAFAFQQNCGSDYYSRRVLSHFLVHAHTGLKVAQIARLVGFSRPATSKQQGLSSKEAIQAAHQRLAGRPHGKLLPRYAGPIAEFMLSHADATRYDVLDFIERTWNVRVSTVALHHFCKKFGLDRATRTAATAPRPSAAPSAPAEPCCRVSAPPGQPVPVPPPPFSPRGPSTPVPSC